MFRTDLNGLAAQVHANACEKGFWGDTVEGGPLSTGNVGEVLMLVVSELSEAMEEYRDGHKLDEVYFSYKITGALPWRPSAGGFGPHRLRTNVDGKVQISFWETAQAGTGNEPWSVWEDLTPEMARGIGIEAKPEGFPIEAADAIIRILDFCGAWGIDIQAALELKIDYNSRRPYKHGRKLV